jgi:aminoglycoside phosphotransferase (APT) family kinase protein
LDPLTSPALAAIHALLADPGAAGPSAARTAEFTACARRVLARVRAELDVVPAIERDRLETWRALSGRVGGGADRAVGLQGEADHIRVAVADAAGNGGDPAREPWFADVVSALADYTEAVEGALPTTSEVASEAGPEAGGLRERLAAYLRGRFPGLPEAPVTAFEVIPGGRAKETTRFALAPGGDLPARLILRRDLGRDTTGTRASAEFPLLRAVHAAGIPVPRPILAEDDPGVLGGSFVIVEEVVGAQRMGELFPELSDLSVVDASFGPDLARALARLHAVRDDGLVAAMSGHHSAVLPHDSVRGFHEMWTSLPKPPFALATEMGFAWLLATPLPASRPRGLVHGDLGAHNFMIRDGRLAAILDWELAHMGDPAEDIGYLRATLIDQMIGWEPFVDAYVAAGGAAEACDPRAVDWFSTWAHVRNSVYVAMFRSWVMAGERSDIESLNAAWDFFARTQRYIARELKRALAAS